MMCGLIDLNTVNDDDEAPSFDSPSSSSSFVSALAASSSNSSVCLELWHACAGPLISLPKKGSVVVYFPQGHLERVSDFPAIAYDLPPHIFCRVVDVKLHAEAATDEVYAQVFLTPDTQIEQKWREGQIEADGEEEDIEGAVKSTTPHMFCKTLTASDTSTHGGFSVPRRAAEDCFPPLDYQQQRPSQELVAKDLHGIEWKFRHIYRGQPRRHLLTTGWSAFVNKKKLVSGDAVLFLRGGDGELRLGIRRAAQLKSGSNIPALCSEQLDVGTITAVVNAISTRSVFNICYNPRAISSEFIIPFHKFSKSLAHSFSVGMRFKMRFETEDAAERRYNGLIVGMSDLDAVRWPGSKWRCLLVRWDDLEAMRHNRVSPWEIEPSGSVSGSSSLVVPGAKRNRVGLPLTKPDFPFPGDGTGISDFGESSRFQKVLQGQEILSFNTSYDGIEAPNHHLLKIRRCFPGSNGSSAVGNGVRNLLGNSDIAFESVGFDESFRSNKVLQGQETFSNSPYVRSPAANQVHENTGQGITDGVCATSSGNGWSALMQGYNTFVRPSSRLIQVSSPSSVLMFQQASTPARNFHAIYGVNNQEHEISSQISYNFSETCGGKLTSDSPCEHSFRSEGQQGINRFGLLKEHDHLGNPHPSLPTRSSFTDNQDLASTCRSSCRLFGFSLTEERCTINKDDKSSKVASPYNSEGSFLSRGEEQLHPKPPLVKKVVGSSCTKGILQCYSECYGYDIR
ncbi:hypothetical protein F0562_013991 [Nyssa sinensis]|uniref:Auxin response factor n=1 Tax=Nyssa sinensis TaxID=561372 RepID=A0A5J4ZM75_9ASTE|nr:hypothetical protein F0562_013991 [Nyssa sinensis]